MSAGMTALSTYRIADYALFLDLLGTAQRMAHDGEWLAALVELLETIDASLPAASTARLFQHGDTIVLASGDPADLATAGTDILTSLFNKGILAQAGLAGGGVYYDDKGFGKLRSNARLQALVGKAVARAFLVTQRIRGPRFFIDEESVQLPARGVGERYIRSTQHREPHSSAGRSVTEVRWWRGLSSPLPTVLSRITTLESQLAELTADKKGPQEHMASLIDRDIDSLQKRQEHWKAFADILRDDPQSPHHAIISSEVQ